MAVPWTGIPLAAVLKAADPLAQATHVRFISFDRPSEAPHRAGSDAFPWPYTEGLTLAEATHDLTFLALGVYGRPLLKQHGAPVRVVVPWKYGYKSAKSIVRIELVGSQPATFWNTLNPAKPPRTSYLRECLGDRKGPFIAATDYIRAVPDQVRQWMPGRYAVLGTDGFGRSDSRAALRRFFEVDRHYITVAALKALSDEGNMDVTTVTGAMRAFGIDPKKPNPVTV